MGYGLTFIAAPILTRLYTPSNFGTLALFVSITSILSIAVCWRYELAIMLPEKDDKAVNVFALAVIIAIGMSIIYFLVVLVFREKLATYLKAPSLVSWLWCVPLITLCTGLHFTFNYWSSRKKRFKRIAASNICQSGSSATTQIGVGITTASNVGGLIGGYMTGQIAATTLLGKQIYQEDRHLFRHSVNLSMIKQIAIRYQNFPFYSIWSGLMNTVAIEMAPILLSCFFGLETVGFYALGHRIINVPTGIVGKSLNRVFFQKATELHRENASLGPATYKVIKNLFLVSVIPFLFIAIFAPQLFSFLFGEKWYMAGVYVRILMPLHLLKFAVIPVNTIFAVTENQKAALTWQVVFFLVISISFIIGGLRNSVYISLILYSFGGSIMYLIMIFLCLRFSGISFQDFKTPRKFDSAS
ncbi:oligosaccharide flippase family protein [Candidatus Pacearchaeota archaeon]|nr:oligosaccharide flippase family protein [Candidatus Pacearchaeota archaeon]